MRFENNRTLIRNQYWQQETNLRLTQKLRLSLKDICIVQTFILNNFLLYQNHKFLFYFLILDEINHINRYLEGLQGLVFWDNLPLKRNKHKRKRETDIQWHSKDSYTHTHTIIHIRTLSHTHTWTIGKKWRSYQWSCSKKAYTASKKSYVKDMIFLTFI